MKKKLSIFLFVAMFFMLFTTQAQNYALSFTDQNQTAKVLPVTVLELSGSLTIEAWIYPTSWKSQVYQGCILNKEGINYQGYMLRCGANGTLNFNIGTGSTWKELNSPSGTLVLNTWQHVAGVFDGTQLKIYVNGVQIGTPLSYTGSVAVNDTIPLEIGRSHLYHDRNFPGKIDEVRVWNTALTSCEIYGNYRSTITTSHPKYSNLVAYYEMDNINTDTDSDGNFDLVATVGPSGEVYTAPYILSDNLLFSGSTVPGTTNIENYQSTTSPASLGGTNQHILKIEVEAFSDVTLSQIVFQTNGTTSTSDILNARVWYTGANYNFSTTTQFGATETTPPVANTNMTFTGSQTLPCGKSYLWLTYDINPNATLTNLVDGSLVSATIDGVTLYPLTSEPTGARPIAATCQHTLRITATTSGGWNGGLVDVNVNGSPVLTGIGSTFTSGTGPVDFIFNAGTADAISVIRTTAGNYPTRMRVQILDGNGTSVLSAVEPTTAGVNAIGYCGGIVHTTAATLITAYSAQLNGDFANCVPIESGFRYKQTTSNDWIFVQDFNNPMAYDLQGLVPATNYHYQAYAIVGIDTLWGTTINFATICVPLAIPYIEEFNSTSFPLCWSQTYSGGLTSNRWSVSTGTQAGGSANQMMCSFQNNIGISRLISPAIDFGQVTNPTLIFKYMFDDYGAGATLKIQTSTDLINWTDQPFSLASSSNTNIGPATVNVLLTIPGGVNYVAWVVDGNHYQIDYWYIDNVSISLLTCIAPSNLQVSNINTTNVTLNWNRGESETQWEVAYKTAAESNWTLETAYDTTYLLQNLLPATTYNIKVRSACAPGDESFWTAISTFSTMCDPISTLPIIENCETTPLDELPLCFSKIVSGNASVKVVNDGGNKVVKLTPGAVTNNCYLVFPALTEPVNNIRIQFKYFGGDNHLFRIGYFTDPNDTTTFQLIHSPSISGSGTWKTFDIISNNTMTGSEKIAIRLEMPSGSYVYLDSITVSIQPQCLEPSALTVVNSNLDDITVSWVTLAPTSNLEYKESTSTTWTTLSGVTSPYTVSALTQNTAYDFRVQSVCDGGILSNFTSNSTFSTLCELITALPYVQDFESTTVNQIPTCYEKIVSGSATVKVVNSDGSNVLNFDAGSTSNNCYIVLPKVNVPLNTLRIMFKYYGGSNHVFKIGYLTNPSDPSSFVQIHNAPLSTSGTWKTFDLYSSATLTGNERIALRFYMPYGNSARIDSLTIMNMPSCVPPFGLTATNVTAFDATLNWTSAPVSTPVDYTLEYKTNTETVWTSVPNVNPPYTLPLLQPMTNYQFRVQANCSTTDISDFSSSVSFTTLCAPLTPPTVSETFATVLPNQCWSMYSGNLPDTGNAVLTSVSYGWGVRTNIAQNTAYSNIYSNNKYWLITPSIDLGDGTIQYQIDFDLARTAYNSSNIGNLEQSATARFIVLISTDNGTTWNSTGILKEWNNSTGTPFSTLTNSLSSQSIPIFDSVAMLPYSGLVKFAFLAYSNTNTTTYDNDIHIDNFQVNPYNPCTRPSNLTNTSINSTSVNLQWIENGSATSWNIEYGPVGFTHGSGTMVQNISSNPYLLQGLTSNTTYQIYVQSDCGGGSTSNYSIPITITTGLIPVTLPYNNDFENPTTYSDFGFLNGTQVNKFVIGSASGVNNTVGGSNALYISNDNGTTWAYTGGTTNASRVYSYIDISVPTGANEILLDFDWIAQGSSAVNEFLRVYMMPVNIPVTAGNIPPTVNSVNYDLTAMIGNYTGGTGQHWLSQQSTWQHKQFNINTAQFPNLAGNTWRLYFHWRNDQATAVQPPATIDNISITVVSCTTPTNLHSNSITSSSVDLEWNENGTSTNWALEYGPTGFALGSGTQVQVTDNPHLLQGLTPATTYDFYVQSNCGVGDNSGWSNKLTITTSCVATTLPYTENFNASTFPVCWSQTYSGGLTSNRWSVIAETNAGGTPNEMKCNYQSGTGISRLISPAIDFTGITSPVLSFKHYYNDYQSGATLKIQSSTDLVNWTDQPFTITSGSGSAGPATITINLTLSSGVNYIAWVIDGNHYQFNYWYIDDVAIYNNIITCTTPNNLAVSAITSSTATATWTAGGTETQWEVAYKPTAASTWNYDFVSAPTYYFSTLTAETAYDVKVRAICTVGDTSAYTAIVNFTTATPPCNIPTNLQVPTTGITDQTAVVTWTAGGTETQWQVEYKLVSSSNWTTMPISTTTTQLIQALQSNSSYEVRVKALCGGSNESPFTTPVQFTTTGAGTFTIATSVSGSGTITPSGNVVVSAGADQEFIFIPGQGTSVVLMLVDGVETLCVNNSYTFENVIANHTLDVTFAEGIEDNNLSSYVSLYPNPTNSIIELKINQTQLKVRECQLYDIYGKLIKVITISEENTKIDVSDYASGVYFVKMNTEMGVITKKFVKK